jgi:hypothetical protein
MLANTLREKDALRETAPFSFESPDGALRRVTNRIRRISRHPDG